MLGRPPQFENPEQMLKAFEEYFSVTPPLQYTITGLALYLGFESRQSFYDYEKKPDFSYIVKQARMLVENSYEQSLRTQSVTGAIFALKNMGWKDKQEVDSNVKLEGLNLIIEMPDADGKA